MKAGRWILLAGIIFWGLWAACADWQVKTTGEQPATSQEEPTPQGKTTIGGEEGRRAR